MAEPPSIEEVIARARAGEARAQYVLAASLSRAGKRDEAEGWLQSAAKGGEPDALYTLATRELHSMKGAARAVELLSRAAAGGGTPAARLFAVLRAQGYGIEPDWTGALSSVLALARAGDPSAQREIAGLLILDDPESAVGASLIESAAEKDLVAAAVVATRRAAGRSIGDAAAADRALRRLEEARYPRTAYLREKNRGKAFAAKPAAVDWNEVAARIASPPNLSVKAEQVLRQPDVRLFASAAPSELLEYIIAQAAPRLAPSTTVDSRDGSVRRDSYRTSLTATLGPVDQDLVIVAINRCVAALASVDHQNAEFLSVLRYAPGDEYRPHFDWLAPGPDFDRGGQRIKTALLYLNDDYEGGETHFLTADRKIKGKPGDLLVFSNALPDGSGDKASGHAGLPVVGGNKWLGSYWFRERRYQF
jgi:hypothetical protein